jgi:Asp/Glu/hydantoin racemase
MRILFINPNTSEAITERVVATARAFAAPGTEIRGATGRFGARYIVTRAASAIAAHATLDAYAHHGQDADVVVLGCFGDPGLDGLKELAHQPVIGMAEAACHAAITLGRRFAIVTGGSRWVPMLEEFVASIGLTDRLAVVKAVAPSGGDIARDPERAYDLLAAACNEVVEQNETDSVILGGAGLAGIAAEIAARVSVPVIDAVGAAVKAAEALGNLRPAKPRVGSYAPTTPVETVGLAAALAARMHGE